jgi:cytochrome c oxidase subunit 2
MAAETAAAPRRERRHGLELLVIWLVLSLAADLVIWFIWRPHLPPGDMTSSAHHQQFDTAVLAVSGAPVVVFVLLYFVYAIIVWRQRPGDETDGPPIHGNAKISAAWIIITSAIVLWAFAFGTVELIRPAGVGAGEGPAPIWRPANAVTTASWSPGTKGMLQVQVIGQEWYFTYRYPQFGGMESAQLLLPNNATVEFHVTSLDVIHSFWAYLLGVKADANPNTDNVAFTTTRQLGGFVVRCNELCGLWHGAMFNHGRVVTQAAFQSWATSLEARERANGTLAALPPYSTTYDPTVIPQLGKAFAQLGITGGNGYYYSGAQASTPGPPVSP